MNICRKCGSEVQEGQKVCSVCGSAILITQQAPPPEKASPLTVKQWMVRGLAVTVILVGIGVFLNQLLRTYHPVIDAQPEVAMATMYRDDRVPSTLIPASMEQGSITIPLNIVKEKKLVRFFDPENVQDVPMIAYVTPQGKLVTAMSKSEHCGSTDFYLSGNDIHCAGCGSYWNMASMEAYACCQKYYPDPFPSRISGDKIVINPAVVRGWKSRL